MIQTIVLQLAILAFAQLAPSTSRTGDLARSLTEEDIATFEQMVGARPWLVDGVFLGPESKSQSITAYFEPTTVTPMVRRGAYLKFTRDLNSSPGPWSGVGSAQPYFQVAVPGRPFQQIENDEDLNRPFTVKGSFQNEELVELVTFLRSNPGVIPSRGQGTVGKLPIASLERLKDGSVRAEWNYDLRLHTGQTAVVEKRGSNWAVVSLSRYQIYVN
jgi:hypothetical protein